MVDTLNLASLLCVNNARRVPDANRIVGLIIIMSRVALVTTSRSRAVAAAVSVDAWDREY